MDMMTKIKVAWPLLYKAYEKELFLEVDLFFAEMLLKGVRPEEEKAAIFLSYLLAAARDGHLCVVCEGNRLYPPFLGKDPELSSIPACILQGALSLTPSILQKVEDAQKVHALPVCRRDNTYYLQKNWVFESKMLENVVRLKNAKPKIQLSLEPVSTFLNEEQKEAVASALSNSLSIVTGGPGTGKSFTAVEIVKTFLSSLPRGHKGIVAVAAPTGKAASQLEKNLRGAIADLDAHTSLHAGTLHLLLGIRSSEDFFKERRVLFADLLIVDEASMLDARLFSFLLSSLQEGGRTILMGDKDQLPPVDSGSLFSDLVDCAKLGFLKCIELKKCLRAERQEILSFAQAINLQSVKDVQMHLESSIGMYKKSLFLSPQSVSKTYDDLWQCYKEHFHRSSISPLDPKDILNSLDGFRILSCVRKGPYGVDALNRMICKKCLECTEVGNFLAFPILITRNEYSLNLFNGEVGVLMHRKKSGNEILFDKEDKAYFYDKKLAGELREMPALIVPAFEFAFCLSVHKSQGSEYEKVLVLVPESSENFGKEVLYTAVTRAKKNLEIAGSQIVIQNTIDRSSRKISGLHARLRQKGGLNSQPPSPEGEGLRN